MKLKKCYSVMSLLLSPPMRGRGLKLFVDWEAQYKATVAPHAGAWIETHAT